MVYLTLFEITVFFTIESMLTFSFFCLTAWSQFSQSEIPMPAWRGNFTTQPLTSVLLGMT